jgi:lysine 6-dehydrogenase
MTTPRDWTAATRAAQSVSTAPRLAVVGCGAMGMAAAFAIATNPELVQLRLIDRDTERLRLAESWLLHHAPNTIIECSNVDVATEGGYAALASACEGVNAVGLALPWSATSRSIQALACSKIPIASITRPDYAEIDQLEKLAARVGCSVLLPIGLEPGLTEIFAVEVARKVSKLEALTVRCGGLPEDPIPPLNHTVLFGGRLSLTPRPAYAVERGQLVSLLRFDGLESVHIDGVGVLEAHHDGMLPWLPDDPAVRGALEISQKTLRWPGYTETIRLLLRLGLLDGAPIDVDGAQVSPRRLVEQVLSAGIAQCEKYGNLTILTVDASGRDQHDAPVRARLQCCDRSESETGLSSMARLTGFTLAIALQMLSDGAIAGSGLIRPHEVFRGELTQVLMSALRAHGINITQTIVS